MNYLESTNWFPTAHPSIDLCYFEYRLVLIINIVVGATLKQEKI